jgi:hypothetical protein
MQTVMKQQPGIKTMHEKTVEAFHVSCCATEASHSLSPTPHLDSAVASAADISSIMIIGHVGKIAVVGSKLNSDRCCAIS